MSACWRRAAALLLLAAGVACCLAAVQAAEKGLGMDGVYRLRYEQPQVALPTLLDTLEEDGERYALFQESIRTVQAPLFRRERRVVHIEQVGEGALLFLPDRLLAGSYPTDPRGCVVDLSTARELWGSDAPLGMELEWDGRVYDVVGIVQASRPLVLTCGEAPFQYSVALYRPGADGVFPQQAVQEFEQALSTWSPLRADAARLPVWTRLLARLPLLLLFVAAALHCLRSVSLHRGLRLVAAPVCTALGGWLLRLPNPVTPELLPTRWSDFTFWQRQIESAVDELCTAWMLPGTLGELLLLREVVLPAMGWTAAACACLFAAHALGKTHLGAG